MDENIEMQLKESDVMSRAFVNLKKKGQQTSKGCIRARLEALEKKWSGIEARHKLLLSSATEDDEGRDYFKKNFFEGFEEIYYAEKGKFLDALDALDLKPAPTSATQSAESKSTSRKLPTINLPQFTGKYADWPSFKDMFTAFMAHDSTLEDVERLYFLKSSLSGEAANLLKSIPVTGDNYARAWERLKTHYDNKRKLIYLCLESLFQLSPVTTESASALKALRDGTTEVIETLQSLQRPVDKMHDLFVHLTVRRLDHKTRRDWELSLGDTTVPTTWKELDAFLKSRIEALEMTSAPKSALPPGGQPQLKKAIPSSRKPGLTAHNVTKPHVRSCSYCQGDHYISSCDQFRACSIDNRHAFVSEKQLCYNCLGVHRLNDCRSKVTCASCQRRHHTLLHRSFQRSKAGNAHPQTALAQSAPQSNVSLSSGQMTGTPPVMAVEPPASQHQATNSSVTSHATQTPPGPPALLLATAQVSVLSERNCASFARALIDPCSEASFMAESLAQRIRTPRQSTFVPVTGVGATPSYTAKSKATICISPHFQSDNRWRLTALILPRLTDYVPSPRTISNTDAFFKGLILADPQLNSTDPVELIIGADLYPQLIEEGLRKGPEEGIIAQATGLGWILTGSSSTLTNDPHAISSLPCHVDLDLAALLTRFWQQEEVELGKPMPLTKDERECEDHFVKTHTRNADGRYVLRLPFKSNLPDLGDSREAALSALHRAETRFKKQPEFRAKYHKFMQDYISLGHMKEFSTLYSASKDSSSFLLPHHGVFKTHGDTSKLRVVFNGSVRLPSGLSINECLHIGPKLQLDPFDVLLRWRIFCYVFSADIEKMFRQILIAEEDQVFQQILWYVDLLIMIFNLCTVTYGLGPSPYQAIRTLQQLAADEGARFPRAAQVLLKQTYMDDIFAGADTLEEAIEIKHEIVGLLKAGGFPLSKWTANHPSLLSDVPDDQQATTQYLSWHEAETIPMLGVAWQPLLDVFCFQFNFSEFQKVTKRSALSVIAQLYDPLGWITPVTISFKIFMQSLWHDGLEWDEDLPILSKQRWNLLIEDLLNLQHFSMPRWVGLHNDLEFVELHGFSDASERAFAACLYLRTVDKAGNVRCILLTSKSKVAPLKQVSLPRLELCGAVMLARLAHRVRRTMSLETSRCHCWSDSTITLAWIKETPTTWKTYVANRVSEIQTTLPNAAWHHIPGIDNPADLPSRGISASDLVKSSLWLHGPSFLSNTASRWTSSNDCNIHELQEETLERRSTPCLNIRTKHADPAFIARFSSLNRLLRQVARWFRPVLRARARIAARAEGHEITKEELMQFDVLTPARLLQALQALVYWVQQIHFAEEINCLLNSVSVPRKSALIRLYPILDEKGHLRVGGRLRHSLLHPDEKHPFILPQLSNLSKLLVLDAHIKTLHGGTQLTLNYIRQRFWILRGRQLVKTLIFRCLRCWRQRAQPTTQLMDDLPFKRVQQFRPFLHSGVDYAGPIYLRFSKGRGAKSYKGYVCVFVCLSTRAVHLEAVSGYSAADFLAAYKRFTARRGICASVTSDCGLNFVGADKELRCLFEQASAQHAELACLLAADGTEWHFNPPGAPHFGGIWEAAVKSVKFHLKRVIGEALLTFEEMTTLLAQIEACLNSRPLQPLSDDPDNLDALTPGHFLIGVPTLTVPEPSLLDFSTSRLDRWQMLRHMYQDFWRRWSEEYLQTLQLRPKWRSKESPVKVGDLCLLRSELYPPCKWPLARITAVHPGSDGLIRVVEVKTSKSSYTRPISKVSILPLDDDCSPASGEGGRNVPKTTMQSASSI